MFCEIDRLFFNLLLLYSTDFLCFGNVTLGTLFDSVVVLKTGGVSVADVELGLCGDGVFLVVYEE